MLYEVITIRWSDGDWLKSASFAFPGAFVITSYSIHYTKLYDERRQHRPVNIEVLGTFQKGGIPPNANRKPTETAVILYTSGTTGRSRITSYNVCYTKLLRMCYRTCRGSISEGNATKAKVDIATLIWRAVKQETPTVLNPGFNNSTMGIQIGVQRNNFV